MCYMPIVSPLLEEAERHKCPVVTGCKAASSMSPHSSSSSVPGATEAPCSGQGHMLWNNGSDMPRTNARPLLPSLLLPLAALGRSCSGGGCPLGDEAVGGPADGEPLSSRLGWSVERVLHRRGPERAWVMEMAARRGAEG